jgi:hypothetical protein
MVGHSTPPNKTKRELMELLAEAVRNTATAKPPLEVIEAKPKKRKHRRTRPKDET